MQNRYTGDIGDFSKLGILRVLRSKGLTIGMNWYLTPDENHNKDGRHTEYLNDERYRHCDEELWLELGRIVKERRRTVSSLERDNILPAVYYSEVLDLSGVGRKSRDEVRRAWHGEGLKCLDKLDVICVDPDNGLIVPSAIGSQKANKYVLPEELFDYYRQGSTVIYYQHKARRRDQFYIDQQESLMKSLSAEGAVSACLKFMKVSQRYYFFIVHPEHEAAVTDAIEDIKRVWGDCFQDLTGRGDLL